MNNSPIGVFDSGVGGLTVAREIMRELPDESIVYFGDTARVPYGSKSRETVTTFSKQIIRFLKTKDVKAIVIACNTASAFALHEVAKDADIPIIGVIEPGARTANNVTENGRVGIIATEGTVRSGTYEKVLKKINPNLKVFLKACPLFVPLVENGFICRDDQIVRLVIRRYLSELKETGVDTLILGCTHYPLLRDAIADFMGDGVTLVDSGYETAIYCSKILRENNLLNTDGVHQTPEFYVSDTPDGFKSVAGLFLGRNMEHTVTQIDIEQY